MQKSKGYQPILAALGAMIFWSFSFVWVKIAYEAYHPITVVFIRLCFSVLLLFPFAWFIRRLQIPSRKELPVFILLSFFQPFLYFMGESFGLKYVSSTVASVIVATIPLFAPLFAWYFYREKLSAKNVAGLAVSFFGVIIVVLNPDLTFSASPLGVILEFIAVLSAIAYSTVLRKLSFRYSTFSVIAWQNLFGIVMFLPFWLAFEARGFVNTAFHWEAFRAILLLSVFASSLAFILFTYSVRNMGINRANTYVYLIPVFTAIFSRIILDEVMTFRKAAGILIVIIGLFMATLRKKS